jgi:hypothetical protein
MDQPVVSAATSAGTARTFKTGLPPERDGRVSTVNSKSIALCWDVFTSNRWLVETTVRDSMESLSTSPDNDALGSPSI